MKVMVSQYTVSHYLLDRLEELGLGHLFGVPSDYNLPFLDVVLDHPQVEWVGNRNELDAAYAADGYARIRGIGALTTGFGVGELSAVNGIAGACAEHVPVVEITGGPSTRVMAQGAFMHHTLCDGDFGRFARMYREVTAAQTVLTEVNAAEEIDRVLLACVQESRPVHIVLPTDVFDRPVRKPLGRLRDQIRTTNAVALKRMLGVVIPHVMRAQKPVILLGLEVSRYRQQEFVRQLAVKLRAPVASLCDGKGAFDESQPDFVGMYLGALSDAEAGVIVDGSDCVIQIGVRLTDSTVPGFHVGYDRAAAVDIRPYSVELGAKRFGPIRMADALQALIRALGPGMRSAPRCATPAEDGGACGADAPTGGTLKQRYFFRRLQTFLKEGDIVAAEQGSAFSGLVMLRTPRGIDVVSQPSWASIGFSLPALLGAQLADVTRRAILLIGDGSFQLTGQELSTMLAQDLKPIIFLINNDGYTIERIVHGGDKPYNDVPAWQYHRLPEVFDQGGEFNTFRVETEAELEGALQAAESEPRRLAFVELVVARDDKPALLEKIAVRLAQTAP